jgi:hypothetical protein
MVLGKNPFLWQDRLRPGKARHSPWRAVALVLLVAVGYHVIAKLTACHAVQPDRRSLFEPMVWASMVLLLAGTADQAARHLATDISARRLEILWSTPVLQESLLVAVVQRSERWLFRSGLWVGWAAWCVGPGDYPANAMAPEFVGMLGAGVVLAGLGGLMGTWVALQRKSGAGQTACLGLVAVALVIAPAAVDIDMHSPWCMLSGLVLGYSLTGMWAWNSLQASFDVSVPGQPSGPVPPAVGRVFQALDRVLRMGARRVGVDRNAFFRAHRARALRRFQARPLWTLLAVLPAVTPLVLTWVVPMPVALAVTILAFPLSCAWWVVGGLAAQDALGFTADSRALWCLTPVDVHLDPVAVFWGRLYPVGLAWLLQLPFWLLYGIADRAPLYAVLMIPVLGGLLCFGHRDELEAVRRSLHAAATAQEQ